MSILSFLRVIQGIKSKGGAPTPPARNRRLELEALERRAVLTVLDATDPLLESLEAAASTTTLESAPLTEPLPSSEETLPLDNGGSGSGTGGPAPGDPTSDPSTETLPTDGGSTGGSGEPPPDPPPPTGGSGSGTGTGSVAPVITSFEAQAQNGWVVLVGTVTDADGPVEGLIVYFTIDTDTTIAFTTTVQADGTFQSLELTVGLNTRVNAYTIDAQGNQSNIVFCFT